MKKLLLLSAVTLSLWSCTQNKYVIDGNITGLKGQIYLLNEQDRAVDSAVVDNGTFRFEGIAETPSVGYLSPKLGFGKQAGIIIFLEHGEIAISGNIKEINKIVAIGTPSNNTYADYSKQRDQLTKRFEAPRLTAEEREVITKEFSELSRNFLAANHDNIFGAALLAQSLIYEMSASEMLEALAKFPEFLRQTEMLKKAQEVSEERIKTEAGQPYIDIEQLTPQRTPATLSRIIANGNKKYILVDFWASWCAPCMAEVPYLLKAYKQYKDKGLEIYAVSLDSEHGRWTETIKKQGMEWIHVSSLNRFANSATSQYAVNSIPANFLIDCSTGKFVASNLRGEALEEKLAELLP